MLENISMTWGGAGHLLVPVDDAGEPHPRMWPLVELYDADHWAAYVNTWRGHQLADPDKFDKWLARQARRWAREHGQGLQAAREALTADHMMTEPTSGWPVPDSFAERLRRYTGPLVENGNVDFAMYRADGEPGHLLVNVADLSPLPERVRLVDTSELPAPLQVLISMRLGGLAPTHIQALAKRSVSVETVPIQDDDLPILLSLVWLGHGDADRHYVEQAVLAALGEEAKQTTAEGIDSLIETSPMALSRVGCSELVRWYSGERQIPRTIVVGDHVDDFAYALALQRSGVPALWLPLTYATRRDNLSLTVRRTLAQCLVRTRHRYPDRANVLTSLSISVEELRPIRDRLKRTDWGASLALDVTHDVAIPPIRAPALMDREHFDDPVDLPFHDDTMAVVMPIAVPSSVQADEPWKLTWWTEVDAVGHTLPGRSALNQIAVAQEEGWRSLVRCGRDGVVFFSHTMGFVPAGATTSQLVARPRLRLPSAETAIRELAVQSGLSIAESTAGRFRRLTMELWGGLDALAQDLADVHRSALIRAWLSTERSGVEPGVFTASRRRFLTLSDAAEASGLSEQDTRTQLDRYLELGIVRRGLALKCRHCLLFEWYELARVTQSFVCGRCGTSSFMTSDTWKGPANEPQPYYDLAEVVLQALRGNVHVPVGTLSLLSAGARSFLHMPEVEIIQDSARLIELDIVAIADGRIILGEAKVSDHLEKTKREELEWLQRLVHIADMLTADEVVFATAASTWRPVTAQRIADAFQSSRATVRLLPGV